MLWVESAVSLVVLHYSNGLQLLMWHVLINSPPWGPDAILERLDQTMVQLNSSLIEFPMSQFPLETDGDHFTRNGQRAFHEALADALNRTIMSDRVLILSDSTIDFHNWSTDGEWTGWASSTLKTTLAEYGITNSIVDAVCGSGFISRARHGEHFYARLSHHLRGGYRGPVVVVGGWNDAKTGRVDETVEAMRKCASVLERYDGVG